MVTLSSFSWSLIPNLSVWQWATFKWEVTTLCEICGVWRIRDLCFQHLNIRAFQIKIIVYVSLRTAWGMWISILQNRGKCASDFLFTISSFSSQVHINSYRNKVRKPTSFKEVNFIYQLQSFAYVQAFKQNIAIAWNITCLVALAVG